MSNHDHNLNQSYAFLQEGLDELVNEWRASLGRKAERHGNNFDSAMAITDLASRLAHSRKAALILVASAAVDRLAKMDDYNPVPAELADLDFDVELDKLLNDEAPEGGESDGDE